MKTAFKWVLFSLPIMFVVVMISFGGDHSAAAHSLQPGGHFRGEPFHGSGRVMMVNQSPMMGFLWLPFLFKMGLIIAGGVLLGLAKGSKDRKIVGSIMLSLGILFLLPTILAIPLILVFAYLLYKNLANQSSSFAEFSLAEIAVDSQYTGQDDQIKDYLDEWEKTVRKEEH